MRVVTCINHMIVISIDSIRHVYSDLLITILGIFNSYSQPNAIMPWQVIFKNHNCVK